MDGVCVRGNVFVDDGSVLKLGAKLYGTVIMEKKCVVGGEVKNVFLGYGSNKSHDGYLGDSILGRYCNIGAGTNGSNVKNTGGDVVVTIGGVGVNVGLKAGCVVGDFTRIGIGMRLGTGLRIGVCCNVVCDGVVGGEVGNFKWLDRGVYDVDKLLVHLRHWKGFKREELMEEEILAIKKKYYAIN